MFAIPVKRYLVLGLYLKCTSFVLQVRIFKLLYILLKIFEVYLFCAPGEGRATPGRRANPGRKPPPVYLHYHASHQSMDTIVNRELALLGAGDAAAAGRA